ncbi:hypothetical protein GCM10011492_32310 [Flexivirga endophytica]|uniref:Uncharacterized protein n=1 Tax=Flexivirga endophytica TaxID=1849103 RepID=A0A916TCQ0_9MICO|nr:hypothetical protein GCM10011492_32310 [Flexivirga endophytica]GHB47039.1 hypothetical protein GCM10008112_14700 [Flexivirga endophytica]
MTATRLSSKSGVTSELPEPVPMMARSKCVTTQAYAEPFSSPSRDQGETNGVPSSSSGRAYAAEWSASGMERSETRPGGGLGARNLTNMRPYCDTTVQIMDAP